MDATLILNADAMPINLLPLSSASWEDAIKRLWIGEAEVLHTYDDWAVHSPSVTMRVPSVVILKRHVRQQRMLRFYDSGPSSALLFLRDGYQCQYCGRVFPRGQLTVDHVLPRKYGGRTRWNNVVTACSPCNGGRGHDVRIQPLSKPFVPTHGQLVKTMRRFPITIPHPTWNYYLGWKEERVLLVDPRTERSLCRITNAKLVEQK